MNSVCAVSSRLHRTGSRRWSQSGFTLVEMIVSVAVASLLIAGLNGVIGQALEVSEHVLNKNELSRQARFAMDQMVRAVSHSQRLLLPLADNSVTNWPENIREQTIPASPPSGSSTLASAVLAVSLPSYFDLDANGIADADNDGDGLIDEDPGGDITNDGQPGIVAIDDDGDGTVDASTAAIANEDDDEDNGNNEDQADSIDNDGDGSIDEDPGADNNNDGCAGICAVDDNANAVLDESASSDDDEDGSSNEDWYDPLVFYLDNGTLIQRTPVPWDEDGNGTVNGLDFIVSVLAENVTRLRIERTAEAGSRSQLVEIILELTSVDDNENVSLNASVRIGSAL